MSCPGFTEAAKEGVWPAQKQHFWPRRITLGQCGKVLMHNRFKETRDNFLFRNTGLQQAIGIRFGEDSTLCADLVQGHACMAHLVQIIAHNFKLAG